MEKLRQRLVNWIADRVRESGAEGTVVGLSGGVDSAVVAALCRQAVGDRCLALIMPIASLPEDIEHARLVAGHFGIEARVLPLEGAYGALLDDLCAGLARPEARPLARANLKPRLRMVALYYCANALNYLVVGTSNRSELAMGYFTKFGDGAADILPIAGLVKSQVCELAVYLGVPQPIIDKPPSAGLWVGQTDEAEMGLTYAEIDRYLLHGEADPGVACKIEGRIARSQHKLQRPPIAPVEDLLRRNSARR
ncbi:MAG: NAD(+) synthase [Dehalococcoidales bacterium]|nr:NAD(+) synthase [Dehalococcoidales bacterium]